MGIDELLTVLNTYLAVKRYPIGEQGGIYHPSAWPIRRLGLALEPDSDIGPWTAGQQFDALWLHRPWQLAKNALPADVGVIYHHLPFDETLTMGFNRPLADVLKLTTLEDLGYKQAHNQDNSPLPKRAIGMIGHAPARSFADWQTTVTQLFGGYDQAVSGRQDLVDRVAVVGAMNDALIREAADRGAHLYLTGQYRKAAQEAVDETGLAVIAVGHHRSEEWGLRALAGFIQEHFPTLEVVYKKSGQPGS